MTLLTWIGEHPILGVVLLIVIFAGLEELIRAWRGEERE